MKVKLLKKYNRYAANEVVEVSEIEATNLLKRGVADIVKAEKKAPSNKMEKKPKTK